MGGRKSTTWTIDTAPKGRKRGSRNRISKKLIRERLSDFVDLNFENIQEDIIRLPRKDRVKCIMHLLQYVTPKMSAGSLQMDLDNLNDEQLVRVAELIMTKSNG